MQSLTRAATAALLIPATAFLAACGSDETNVEVEVGASEIAVEVVEVRPGPFEDVVELTGTAKAPEDAVLSPEASGTLTYLASLGTFVRRGATVAQVSSGMASAAVSSAQAGVAQAAAGISAAEAQRRAAQAQLDLAQDTYRRQEPLYRDSILSAWEFQGTQTQLAAARAQVAQTDASIAQARGAHRAAQAGLQQARVALSNTRVTAPFAGTVEEHLSDRGQTVAPGTPVLRLVSAGGLLIRAGVPERYAADVRMGSPVRILPGTAGGEARGGRIVFVGQAVDPDTRTLPIEVALDQTQGALRPAMVVRMHLSRSVLNNVLTVPDRAVIRDERGAGVLVVRRDSGAAVARYQSVTLGPSGGGRVVVTGGLERGDLVVSTGQSSVSDGDRVRIAARVDAEDVATAE
jgi:membrane fusion protein (multidrug efflux system)